MSVTRYHLYIKSIKSVL